MRITFALKYPNINQFTFNSLLTKTNSVKINYLHRRTKHTNKYVAYFGFFLDYL